MAFNRDFYRARTSGGGVSPRSAIASTRAIANLKLDLSAPDEDVSAVSDVLRPGSLPVTEVADALSWDSKRVAEALARGGREGILSFSKTDDTTTVSLETP